MSALDRVNRLAEEYKKKQKNPSYEVQSGLTKVLSTENDIRQGVNIYGNISPLPKTNTAISNDIFSTMSYKDLYAKKSELSDKLSNYERKKNDDYWWDDDNNIFKNIIRLPGQLMNRNYEEERYLDDPEYDALVKEYQTISKLAEDKYVEEKKYENGFTGFIEKTGDTVIGNIRTGAKGIESTISKILGDNASDQLKHSTEVSLEEKLAQKARQETEGFVEGAYLDVVGSASRMLPNVLVGGVAGGTAATITGFANYGGGAYNQAIQEGYTEEQATKYGIAIGALEMATTKALGSFGNIYGQSKLGGASQKIIDSVMPKIISNKQVRNVMNQFVAEGTEEFLQEYFEGIARDTLLDEEGFLKSTWANITDVDKFKDALYSGLVGGITGATMAAPSQIDAYNYEKTTGRNAETGLTTNEQTIIDKEIENRITEAQKDGKVLTNKEKTKIEEQVKEELQKGYISTDTIESTLGGDVYNTYKSTLDKKTAIENEIKELENKNFAELKVAEKERLDSLREELKTIDTNTLRSNLESSMSQKIANDNYLQRSYQEKANKSVKFEADLSKYDVKQQEVVQKAIDSGILNNTNKTHEFVDMIAKISADKGVSFDFANNAKLKESGFAVEGKQVNGLVNENGITVNIDSSNALNKVVGHEITHVLEGTELYTELQQAVKEYATTKGEYDTKLANLTELYKGVDNANIENELTSDLVGEYLFTDVDFVNNLSTTKPNLFQKIYNEIKYLYKIATAGSKEAKQLEKVKKTFEEAYRNSKNVSLEGTNTKYSIVGIKNIQKTLNNKDIDNNQKQFLNKILDNYNVALTKENTLSNEEIRQETGWFKDKNGDWKFEITDAYSKLKIMPKANTEYKLGDILDHKLLFDIDPSLKDIKVVFADKKSGRGNYINLPLVRRIVVNNKLINEGSKSIKGTLLHEVQHHNQHLNKFAQGTSSGTTLQNMIDYVNSLGEIEAKTVQERMDLTQKELKNIVPEMSKENPQHPLKNRLINKRKQEIANSSKNRYNNSKKGLKFFEEEGISVFQQSEVENSNSNIWNGLKGLDNSSFFDTKYSLSEDTAPKQSNLTYGEDVALQISPLQEEISKVVEEVQQMREQIDKMVTPMPEYKNNTYEDLEVLEQQYNEDFENLDTENVPQGIDDDSTFFLPNEVNAVESEKQVKDVIRNTLGLNTKQTSDVYKSIVAIEDFDINDVKNAIEEYSQFITSDNDTNLQDLKKAIRTTKLDISYLKATDSNFKDQIKNAFGTMRIANSGQSIDSFYNEMSSLYPELLPNNIDNEADQFQRLLEVSKMDHVTKYTEAIPEETMNAIAKEVYQTIKNYQDNLAIQNSNRDFFNAVKNGEIVAPVEDTVENIKETPSNKETKISPTRSEVDWDSVEDTSKGKQATFNDETQTIVEEDLVKKTKKELRRSLLGTEIQREFFTSALDNAKNRSMALMNNTDTIRNTELVFGRDAANVINEKIFQKEIDNEANSIKWQNEQRKEIKDLGIKARSKESAAVQKYGEKQYVNDVGEVVPYGDAELISEFPDVETQSKIKNAAKELRSKYDTYIDLANGVLTKLGFDPIPKRNDYMRHFQELNDVFSRYGIPFNAQNMAEHTLPTDINGLTEFWSPQKNYFANMQARKGVKTTYDAITGIDGYISGISNLIFHTEDIQRGRAFEELIRETYGEDKGWDNLENLPDELKQARAEKIQDNHLSNYAAWVHEWTNNIAGKKAKIDRSVESLFGRKAFSFLDTSRKQIGSNLIGLNISSSLTNLIAPVKAAAKTKKLAFAKGTADTIKNIFVKDNFIEKNNFLTSRMGTDMISKNAWQKMQDAGYVFMKGMDWFSSNQIVRSKYYELRAKGMSEQQAHAEAGKFAARIMGDRTKGANAQLYNSKLIGLVTQFQLEVNNDLYSMFYDTYQESKENAKGNALKTAAGMTFTLGQLFAFTHLFSKSFEAIAGYTPTLDILGILATALGFDDDDDEKTTSERLKAAADKLVDGLPYVNILTGGGRIPVLSGIPNLVGVATGGKDEYGNELKLEDEMKKLLYLIPPTGGNQFKKTTQGLAMFDKDLPVSGSYTDSGNLRFPVEDTPLNKIQAAMFGQWANKNAGEYFDNKRQPLKEKQIQEYIDLKLPIADYWEYRDGLTEQKTIKDKFEYINGLDVTDEQKNIMINNAVDRKEDIDMSNYDDFESYEEFDFAIKNEEKYEFFQKNNISYNDYAASDESKEAYNWAYNNPEKYIVAKAITEDIVTYRQYTKELNDIAADKDNDGKTISGSRKAKVFNYINNLDLGFEQKVMLAKLEYPSYDEYNYDIVDYLNNDDSIDYQTMTSILTELGFKVDANGNVSWD